MARFGPDHLHIHRAKIQREAHRGLVYNARIYYVPPTYFTYANKYAAPGNALNPDRSLIYSLPLFLFRFHHPEGESVPDCSQTSFAPTHTPAQPPPASRERIRLACDLPQYGQQSREIKKTLLLGQAINSDRGVRDSRFAPSQEAAASGAEHVPGISVVPGPERTIRTSPCARVTRRRLINSVIMAVREAATAKIRPSV